MYAAVPGRSFLPHVAGIKRMYFFLLSVSLRSFLFTYGLSSLCVCVCYENHVGFARCWASGEEMQLRLCMCHVYFWLGVVL